MRGGGGGGGSGGGEVKGGEGRGRYDKEKRRIYFHCITSSYITQSR